MLEKVGLARADPMVGLIFRCTGVLIGMIPLFFFVPDLGSGFRSAGLRSALCFMTSGFLASVVGQVFALNALKRADADSAESVLASVMIDFRNFTSGAKRADDLTAIVLMRR